MVRIDPSGQHHDAETGWAMIGFPYEVAQPTTSKTTSCEQRPTRIEERLARDTRTRRAFQDDFLTLGRNASPSVFMLDDNDFVFFLFFRDGVVFRVCPVQKILPCSRGTF